MEKSRQNEVLVIVPTYNERENISILLDQIFSILPDCHILFVDDNSEDGTPDEIQKYREKDSKKHIHTLHRPGKLGLGTAYVQGFEWALERDYQYMIEMDADLSHDPSVLLEMLELLRTYDVVVGSRYVSGGGTVNWGLLRKLISRCGSLYARIILGLKVRDLTGGFNAWTRHVLENIHLDEVGSEGYAFQIELKYRALIAGFRLIETPIIFRDRVAGISKMSGSIVYEAIWQVLLLRRLGRKKEIPSSSQKVHFLQ